MCWTRGPVDPAASIIGAVSMEISNWPSEHSDALRELFAKAMSLSEIAREINARYGTNYTRNAVLGRGKRMGMAQRPCGGGSSVPPRMSAPAAQRAARQRALDGLMPSKAAFERAEPVTLRCVGIQPRLVSLLELKPGECRYPYGGEKDGEPIAFCGQAAHEASSYCRAHFDLTRQAGSVRQHLRGPVMLRLVTVA